MPVIVVCWPPIMTPAPLSLLASETKLRARYEGSRNSLRNAPWPCDGSQSW